MLALKGESMIRQIPHMRLLVVLAVAASIGGGAYAFTAANTVPSTAAGSGSGAVTGYVVTDVHYALNAATPTNVDSITFIVSPVIPSGSSGQVQVSTTLTSGGPNAYSCTTNVTGDTVTCPTTSPQLTADTLTGLTVVAAQ
jgi:hypothetical protein